MKPGEHDSEKNRSREDSGSDGKLTARLPQARLNTNDIALTRFLNEFIAGTLEEVIRHRVPLLVIASILVIPPTTFLWVGIIVSFLLMDWLLPRLSVEWQDKIRNIIPRSVRHSEWFRDLAEGAAQARPFILTGVYFFCAPFAVVWMGIHWFRQLFSKSKSRVAELPDNQVDAVFFVHNKQAELHEQEQNFFHSPVFGITLLGICASGLPAFISYVLYFSLGIDSLLGRPSLSPQFNTVFLIIGLYLASVGACLSVLFFRAWFSFPLNFMSDEQIVELNETGVRKHAVKGWFASAFYMNRPWAGPDRLDWSEVTQLRYDVAGARLCPMPTVGAFNPNMLLYRILNKMAAFIDGAVDKIGRAEFVELAADPSRMDSGITLKLWELDSEERARLFYAVRKWAPHVTADRATQEKLLGTSVMSEPRYTELWFDLLGANKQRIRQASLQVGDVLTRGNLTIVGRIGSGGQATVYLARDCEERECVLKEFVLSSGEAVGALIDSARDFENEVSLLTQLSHEHIVSIQDFFVEDRRAYIVLTHVPGITLRKKVRDEGRMAPGEAASLAVQMCDILIYLHSQTPPVVHRDITPENFILGDDGSLTLIDFSLASGAKTGRSTTTCMGKHGYTPPEQFQELDCPQSDLYALGATLYFLLTGVDPKPISKSSPIVLVPEIPQALNAVVERATELVLVDRYESAQWIKIDLERWLNG